MRSPAQHPSRLRSDAGGLELDLGLAPASQPRPAAPAAPASGRRPAAPAPPAKGSGNGPPSGRRQAPPVPALAQEDEIELGAGFEMGGGGGGGPSAAVSAALGGGDSAWEDDEHDALEVGLDMGSVRPPAPSEPKAAAMRPAPTGSSPSTSEALPAARPSGRGAATAASAPMAPTGDDYEVKALAAYGPAPAQIWVTPQYAIRVFKRRQELRKLLTQQQNLHEQASKLIREKLAAEVDTIAERHDSEEMAAIMAPIDQADQAFGQRRAQIDAAAGQFAAQFADIEKQLAAEGETRKQRARDREMAQIQVEDAVQKQARVAGEVKRLEAMLAAAHEQAQKAAGGAEFAPPEHARKIAGLEAQRGKLEAQLAARQQAVAEAKAALRDRAAELKVVDDRIRAIHARTSQTEAQAGEARDLAIEGMKQAHQRRLEAYEGALERISAEMPELIDGATRARIDGMKKELAEADLVLERHRLAVDAFDKPSVQKGIGIMVAAVVLLVVLIFSLARVG